MLLQRLLQGVRASRRSQRTSNGWVNTRELGGWRGGCAKKPSGDEPTLPSLRAKFGLGWLRVRPKGGEGRLVPRNLDWSGQGPVFLKIRVG